MVLIYLYIKGLPAYARIIFGVLVGSAFFVLFISLIWLNIFADTLVKFVPADIDYYVHINKNDANHTLDKVIDKVFIDSGVSFLKPDDIKREVAVFGNLNSCQGLIVKVKNAEAFKSQLDNNKIEYNYLGAERFLISSCLEKTSRKNLSIKKTYWPNSLGIYMSDNLVASDIIFQSICSAQKSKGNCLINGELGSDKIKIFTKQRKNILPYNLPVKIGGQEFDFASGGKSLTKFISNFFQLKSSSSTINNLAYLPSALGSEKISSSFLLMNEKSSTSAYLWKKFDLYWQFSLNQPLSGEDVSKLEDALRSEASQEFPSMIITELTDGTKITEFVAKASKFEFIDDGGDKYFNYPDNSASIYYKISSSSLVVTNKKDLLDSPILPSKDNDFIAVKSKILPETKLFGYVKLFEYIWADDNAIYLK